MRRLVSRDRHRGRRLLRPGRGAHRAPPSAPGRCRGRHLTRARRRGAGHLHADRRARRERRARSQIGAERIHRRGALRRDVRKGARRARRARVGGEASRARRFT